MGFFDFMNEDIAIDLGTANTLIIHNDKVVVDEPSIVAIETRTGKVIAVGAKAQQMHGKAHKGIETTRPLKDGVIADFDAAEHMIREFIKKIPSLKKVKSQKRIMSLQLHPDILINDSEQEKHIKEEELKIFNVANEKLKTYLINHELLVGEEQDDDFEDEDELTEEEIERIKKKGSKVIDHDHWTGKYRGAAHSGCNIALRKTRKIPVIFHNLTGKFYFLIYSIFFIMFFFFRI